MNTGDKHVESSTPYEQFKYLGSVALDYGHQFVVDIAAQAMIE